MGSKYHPVGTWYIPCHELKTGCVNLNNTCSVYIEVSQRRPLYRDKGSDITYNSSVGWVSGPVHGKSPERKNTFYYKSFLCFIINTS